MPEAQSGTRTSLRRSKWKPQKGCPMLLLITDGQITQAASTLSTDQQPSVISCDATVNDVHSALAGWARDQRGLEATATANRGVRLPRLSGPCYVTSSLILMKSLSTRAIMTRWQNDVPSLLTPSIKPEPLWIRSGTKKKNKTTVMPP